MRHIREPLLNGLRRGSKPAAIDDFAIFVECAVMAPDISKIDTDRQLNLKLPARARPNLRHLDIVTEWSRLQSNDLSLTPSGHWK
jgi:hypothetical protein